MLFPNKNRQNSDVNSQSKCNSGKGVAVSMRNDCTYYEKDAVTMRNGKEKPRARAKKCMANNGEIPIFQSKCHRNCIKFEKEIERLFQQHRGLDHIIRIHKMNT